MPEGVTDPVAARDIVGEAVGVSGAVSVGVGDGTLVADSDWECVQVPHAVRVGPDVTVTVGVRVAGGVPVRVQGDEGEAEGLYVAVRGTVGVEVRVGEADKLQLCS